MTDKIFVEDYSEKAIVVRGTETKTYKESLSAIGGKWNDKLRNGAGWIFPKTSRDKVNALIREVLSGKVEKPDPTKKIIELCKNLSLDDKNKVYKYLKTARKEVPVPTEEDFEDQDEEEEPKMVRMLPKKKK